MRNKTRILDDIPAKFTVKTLPKIQVDTNYKSIKEMMKLLYANETTPLTSQGGGHRVHTSLIIKPTIHTTLSNTAWAEPRNPRVYPTFPLNATTAHW